MVHLENCVERNPYLLSGSPSALECALYGVFGGNADLVQSSLIGAYLQAAQAIFQGPLSFIVRAPIQAGHRMLYARTTNDTFGIIHDSDEFWALFRAGEDRLPTDPLLAQQKAMEEWRIKPAVYTYVIGEDNYFRFSETGASFFVDFASKHALHRYFFGGI